MASLKRQRVTSAEFDALAQKYPNAQEHANYSEKWLVVGSREYVTDLLTRGGAR